MSEKQRVLDMIEQGKITAAEGLELLNSLEATEVKEETSKPVRKSKYTKLKIKVDIEEEDVKVDVNVPLQLIKVLGKAAVNFYKVIPETAQDEMKEKGIDISQINIEEIMEAIEDGTLEDPSLVDVNVYDEDSGHVKVKVYVE